MKTKLGLLTVTLVLSTALLMAGDSAYAQFASVEDAGTEIGYSCICPYSEDRSLTVVEDDCRDVTCNSSSDQGACESKKCGAVRIPSPSPSATPVKLGGQEELQGGELGVAAAGGVPLPLPKKRCQLKKYEYRKYWCGCDTADARASFLEQYPGFDKKNIVDEQGHSVVKCDPPSSTSCESSSTCRIQNRFTNEWYNTNYPCKTKL